MARQLNFRKLAAVCAALIGISAGCSGSGNSGDIDIEVNPEQPIVINSDLELGDESISAPWILTSFRIKNNSKKVVSILALKTVASGILNGGPNKKENEYTTDDEAAGGIMISVRPNEEGTLAGYLDSQVETTNNTFAVRATFIGWFTEDEVFPDVFDPNERFEKNLFFNCR